jgi:sigma-B regulation protein RsbU (phosphoserine phosphatase)
MPTRKKLDAASILPGLVRKLLAIGDPDELLERVLGIAREFLGADECSLLLVDDDDLVEHVVEGRRLREAKHRVRIGEEGITGCAAAHRQTIIVRDVRRDTRYKKVNAETRSEAAIPILAGDRLLGVLNLESGKIGFFSGTDRHLLELLASQIAVGLRLDEVHHRIERLSMKLGMLNHLGRAGTMMEPRPFLQRVCDVVRRTLDCAYVGAFIGDYEKERVVLLAHSTAKPVRFGIGATQAFSEGMIGAAFRLGETVHAKDVRKDPHYVDSVPDILSEIDVPIRVGDRCVGILDCQATEVGAFSEEDAQVLETLARFLVPTLQAEEVGSRSP